MGAAAALARLLVVLLAVRHNGGGADAQSSLIGDFAPLCENSLAIRNGYGCSFLVHSYHTLATPTSQLRDVCPLFTIGACSAALLDYNSIDSERRRQHNINTRCAPGTFDTMPEVGDRDYEGLEEATSCVPCIPGFADLDGDPRTPCTSCPGGRFSGARSILCLPCRAGSKADAGSSACTSCAAGEYTPWVNDTCTPCAPGVFDHDRDPSTTCAACPPGTYSNSTDLCVACPAGKHDHDSVPTTACRNCATLDVYGGFTGTYTGGNETLCHQCSAGMHDFDVNPATPCCPVACRRGCTHQPDAPSDVLFYPGDCIPFLVMKTTASAAVGAAAPAGALQLLGLAVMWLLAS